MIFASSNGFVTTPLEASLMTVYGLYDIWPQSNRLVRLAYSDCTSSKLQNWFRTEAQQLQDKFLGCKHNSTIHKHLLQIQTTAAFDRELQLNKSITITEALSITTSPLDYSILDYRPQKTVISLIFFLESNSDKNDTLRHYLHSQTENWRDRWPWWLKPHHIHLHTSSFPLLSYWVQTWKRLAKLW